MHDEIVESSREVLPFIEGACAELQSIIANLPNCTPQETEAIKPALNRKNDLSAMGILAESAELHEGLPE
ncbi:MAG TPA: hypothetical protein ACFYDZ_07835 [Candidatus Brocadiaceae bacterium]